MAGEVKDMSNDQNSVREVVSHDEKETLNIDVDIPEHDPRVTTPLFSRTRLELIDKMGGRCWICNQTAEESGNPLEAHHYPIERSLGAAVDWALFMEIAKSGKLGPGPQTFDWNSFDPKRWFTFVDDMIHNGLLICKNHHIGKGEGIHYLPHPFWIAQMFLREGYKFDPEEVIHHDQLA
jgi:hypothetical protein